MEIKLVGFSSIFKEIESEQGKRIPEQCKKCTLGLRVGGKLVLVLIKE